MFWEVVVVGGNYCYEGMYLCDASEKFMHMESDNGRNTIG